MQQLRGFDDRPARRAGTHDAVSRTMRSNESWTLPLQVVMWATIAVGLIMAMAVLMMH